MSAQNPEAAIESGLSIGRDRAFWRSVAEEVSAGVREATLLHEKFNRQTWRVWIDDQLSVIAKLWRRPGIRGAVSRLARVNTGYREWRALKLLSGSGLPSPRPLGYFRLRSPAARHDEAILSGDLGECRNSVARVKHLLAEERFDDLARFENELVSITKRMIEIRLIDTDHRISNFVVTPEGRLVRLDFEHAARVICLKLSAQRYGIMLGGLVGTYVFAVQPDVVHAVSFAQCLAERLSPPRRVLCHAWTEVRRLLDGQYRFAGIASRIELPW